MIAQQELQRAIYEALSSSDELNAVVTGIFDEVPNDQEEPYIEIGEIIETPEDAFGSEGANCVVTLQYFSAEGGKRESQEVAKIGHGVLDPSSFSPSLDGMTLVSISRAIFSVIREGTTQTGIRCRGVARYRVFITRP